MPVGKQAQIIGKIQYSQEKGKTRKVVRDYRWLGAAWRCNQKTFGTSQGGLLGSHTTSTDGG